MTGATGTQGVTGATGASGATGATGAGLTEVETVTPGGTGTALVGNLSAKLIKAGEYELSDGAEEPVLEGCAVVVTVNATEVESTAQAATTGAHKITVMTYDLGTGLPAENSFSLMVTCP